MTAVIQEEKTGCGIASVANILGVSYAQSKIRANQLGIFATDQALWSDTQYVRRLLKDSGVKTGQFEMPFESWQQLPDLALLAIKHHREGNQNFWHWVVFKREQDIEVVLDSARYLAVNERTDFVQMQPAWFIEVYS